MWSLIGLLCFLGIFLFFGTAIYTFFMKDGARKFVRKTCFILSGVCLIVFWFSPFRAPALEIFFSMDADESQEVVKEEPISDEDEQITHQGGVGDSLGILKKQYGNYETIGKNIIFQNGYITLIEPVHPINSSHIDENIVWNMTISFEVTKHPARAKEEAMEVAQSFIPIDAVKTGERTVILNEDYTTDVIEYKSELLASRIDSKDLYGDAEAGTFAIHLNQYTGSDFEHGYFQIGITTGNPEP